MRRSTPRMVAAFLAGLMLATAIGATAAAPQQKPKLATRLARLELRHNELEYRYRALCDTLKFSAHSSIRDIQVRGIFNRLAEVC
jgi:hypothetical protein